MSKRYYLVIVDEEELAVTQITQEPLVVHSLWSQFLRRALGKTIDGMIADAAWLTGVLHLLPVKSMQGKMKAGDN